jgi:hypothetical protein
MGLIIKKKVSLAFLGEDYSDSYIIVQSIPVGEYDKLKGTVRENVISHFISGQIKQDSGMVDITKDNVEELPGEVFVEAFEQMTGSIDPKLSGQ